MMGFSQHEAHATSLAAICPIAAVGAWQFAAAGKVEFAIAGALAAGALLGAPMGARIMARTAEPALEISFGTLMIVVGLTLLWS
jgi:uncharacterized membrane protein YfcA